MWPSAMKDCSACYPYPYFRIVSSGFPAAEAPTWWQRRLAGQGYCVVCTWCAACIDKHKLRAVVSSQLTAPTLSSVLACV